MQLFGLLLGYFHINMVLKTFFFYISTKEEENLMLTEGTIMRNAITIRPHINFVNIQHYSKL